jgi:hypothetical protein
MLYDACWGLQWEIMGAEGAFEYSLGVTPGAMSNPGSAPGEDGVQVLGRLGIEPMIGLRIGVSGGIGPYIGGPNRDPGTEAVSFPGEPSDYDQRLLGVDAEFSTGRLQLRSEGYLSNWQAPLISEDLSVWGGYLEGAYDLSPQWLGAVRVGALTFSEIGVGETGSRTGWDDDVLRVEAALTRRVAREVHVRVGWQRTEFLTGSEDAEDLLSFQLRAVY